MIVLSSHRPQEKCSEEIWTNQAESFGSWYHAFDKILLVGGDEKPSIKSISELASKQPDWVALVNGDIIIDSRWREVTDRMIKHTAVKAAVSGRWNFDPPATPVSLSAAAVTDNGLDCFVAHPAIWKKVADEIPEGFTLGRCAFDTFLLGFFNKKLNGNVGDLTPARLVFHPNHGERGDQSIPQHLLSNGYLSFASMPKIKIT